MLVVHSMNSILLAKNKELELFDVDYTSNTNNVTVCQKIKTYLLQGISLTHTFESMITTLVAILTKLSIEALVGVICLCYVHIFS